MQQIYRDNPEKKVEYNLLLKCEKYLIGQGFVKDDSIYTHYRPNSESKSQFIVSIFEINIVPPETEELLQDKDKSIIVDIKSTYLGTVMADIPEHEMESTVISGMTIYSHDELKFIVERTRAWRSIQLSKRAF